MIRIASVILFLLAFLPVRVNAQQDAPPAPIKGFRVPVCIYKGDTIPHITLKTIYVYPRIKFKNKKQEKFYWKTVRDVKKTLPIAKEVKAAVIETYEYMQTLPTKKEREKHLSRVEKGIKKQYTPTMKKLTFRQGKLLIKLVDRECHQSSYQLIKAFMGPLKATFYQTFASLFGASLKKEYDPEEEDALIERIATLVENGQL